MNNSLASQITELDKSIQANKELVEIGNALDRLRANKDFRKIILTGYFEQEAIRLVHLKAAEHMKTPDRQQSVVTQMDSIGNLHQYLLAIDHAANMARRTVEDDESTREEIINEGKLGE